VTGTEGATRQKAFNLLSLDTRVWHLLIPSLEKTLRLLEMAQRWVLMAERAASAEMQKSQDLKEKK
jgi:hypothetical protein